MGLHASPAELSRRTAGSADTGDCGYPIPPGTGQYFRCGYRRQNLKRVRPPGSVPNATMADRGSTRKTNHGGGPCDGALKGAVMPTPLASGSAGQPPADHVAARRLRVSVSVTFAATPSRTTSASRIEMAIEQRGSRARLRYFLVPAPVWNQNVASSQIAPTGVT